MSCLFESGWTVPVIKSVFNTSHGIKVSAKWLLTRQASDNDTLMVKHVCLITAGSLGETDISWMTKNKITGKKCSVQGWSLQSMVWKHAKPLNIIWILAQKLFSFYVKTTICHCQHIWNNPSEWKSKTTQPQAVRMILFKSYFHLNSSCGHCKLSVQNSSTQQDTSIPKHSRWRQMFAGTIRCLLSPSFFPFLVKLNASQCDKLSSAKK